MADEMPNIPPHLWEAKMQAVARFARGDFDLDLDDRLTSAFGRADWAIAAHLGRKPAYDSLLGKVYQWLERLDEWPLDYRKVMATGVNQGPGEHLNVGRDTENPADEVFIVQAGTDALLIIQHEPPYDAIPVSIAVLTGWGGPPEAGYPWDELYECLDRLVPKEDDDEDDDDEDGPG